MTPEEEHRLAVVEELELHVRKLRHAIPLTRKEWRDQLMMVAVLSLAHDRADVSLWGTGSTVGQPKGLLDVKFR